MNRFQRLGLLFILMMTAMYVYSKERDCIIVHLEDGSKVTYLLDESPKITFVNGEVSFATDVFQMTNIKKYTIGDSENVSINNVLIGGDMDYIYLRGKIFVNLSNPKDPIRLYDLEGKMQAINKTESTDGVVIDINHMAKGMYFLTIGEETIKIIKK